MYFHLMYHFVGRTLHQNVYRDRQYASILTGGSGCMEFPRELLAWASVSCNTNPSFLALLVKHWRLAPRSGGEMGLLRGKRKRGKALGGFRHYAKVIFCGSWVFSSCSVYVRRILRPEVEQQARLGAQIGIESEYIKSG